MIIKSDWHIHTKCSYDATLSLESIISDAKKYGFKKVGIADHANFNDEKLPQKIFTFPNDPIIYRNISLNFKENPKHL